MNEKSPKRDWFYWFVAVFTATQLPLNALILLDFVLHPLEPSYVYQSTLFRLFTALAIVPVVFFIASLVIRRTPRNVTGLFLLQLATSIMATTVRQEARILNSLSVGWVGLWFLPLFFPDGSAFPRRFERPFRWLCVGLILSVYFWVFSAPSLGQNGELPNPLFISAFQGLFPLASTIEGILLLVVFALILPSLIARYRGSNQRVRHQLQWVAWVFFGILLGSIPVILTGINVRDVQTLSPLETLILFLWGNSIVVAPFLAVGNAILRHKLYDIDIIIRRTLIYAVLTTILAAVYFGAVILTQQIFKAATGQTSDLAIVVSTLLIAALFSPIRRRVQDIIDRRLYRRKYDTEKTLAQFQQNLRDEVDMETLKANLVSVVSDTMQPDKIALWVKESSEKSVLGRESL